MASPEGDEGNNDEGVQPRQLPTVLSSNRKRALGKDMLALLLEARPNIQNPSKPLANTNLVQNDVDKKTREALADKDLSLCVMLSKLVSDPDDEHEGCRAALFLPTPTAIWGQARALFPNEETVEEADDDTQMNGEGASILRKHQLTGKSYLSPFGYGYSFLANVKLVDRPNLLLMKLQAIVERGNRDIITALRFPASVDEAEADADGELLKSRQLERVRELLVHIVALDTATRVIATDANGTGRGRGAGRGGGAANGRGGRAAAPTARTHDDETSPVRLRGGAAVALAGVKRSSITTFCDLVEKNATPLGGEDKEAIRKVFRPGGPVCSAFFSLMDFNDEAREAAPDSAKPVLGASAMALSNYLNTLTAQQFKSQMSAVTAMQASHLRPSPAQRPVFDRLDPDEDDDE